MSMGDVVRLQDQINLVKSKVDENARDVGELLDDIVKRLAALEDAATKPGKK